MLSSGWIRRLDARFYSWLDRRFGPGSATLAGASLRREVVCLLGPQVVLTLVLVVLVATSHHNDLVDGLLLQLVGSAVGLLLGHAIATRRARAAGELDAPDS